MYYSKKHRETLIGQTKADSKRQEFISVAVNGIENVKGLAKFTKRLVNRDVLSVNGINVYDILRKDQLLITSAALKQLEEKLQ